MLPSKLYDWLKWVCVILLPATATLVFSLSAIFHWEWGEIAVGVITAVDTFLGALIGVSTAQYNKNKENEDGTRSD